MYASRLDIEKLYGKRHLETLVPADVDFDIAVEAALNQASALIDGYLLIRYTLPLPTIPELLKNFCMDMACWKLAPASDRLTDEITNRAIMALTFLKDVAAGKAVIPGLENGGATGLPEDGQSGASSENAAYFSNPRRTPGSGLL